MVSSDGEGAIFPRWIEPRDLKPRLSGTFSRFCERGPSVQA